MTEFFLKSEYKITSIHKYIDIDWHHKTYKLLTQHKFVDSWISISYSILKTDIFYNANWYLYSKELIYISAWRH